MMWKERSRILVQTVIALILLFSFVNAKAETVAEKNIETSNTCRICIERVDLNHNKQMCEKKLQCESYSDVNIENIVSIVNVIAESAISDPNVSKLFLNCELYNPQLQKSFILNSKIQRN